MSIRTTTTSPISPPPVSSTPQTLDLKRLLSKPAPPSPRTRGSASDSEGFSDSPARSRGGILVDRGFTLPQMKEKEPRLGRSKSVQSLSSRNTEERETPPEKEKRPRNVLRRRPSAQKSAPALPATTSATAVADPMPLLRSSPRSPLTPPISPSPTLSRASTRSNTAPSPILKSQFSARSGSSLDTPLVVPRTCSPGKEGYGGAQARRVRSREWMNEGANKGDYVVNVTDESGDHVGADARKRLRELKGHPFPSSPLPSLSPSPSPSRSRPQSPSIRPHYHPQNLDFSASSSSSSTCTHSKSASRSRSTSRNPLTLSPSSITTTITKTQTTNSNSGSTLTPAAAVVAAYKRQTFLNDRPNNGRTVGGSSSVDTSASISGFSRLSFGAGGGGGGFAAIEHLASQAQEAGRQEDKTEQSEAEGDESNQQFTLFTASAGPIIAVGGRYNHPSGGIERKGSGLRTLTRKVSGRFRRAQSEGELKDRNKDKDEGERNFVETPQRGRPSLQHERPSTTGTGKSGKRATMSALGKGGKVVRSLRLSIDKFPEEVRAFRPEKKEKDTQAPPTPASKSPASAASTPSPSGGGSRIWKLMKRISTGALRERYTQEEPPPPVPSLPKEFMSSTIPPVVVDDEKGVPGTPTGGGFGKSVRKKASMVLGARIPSSPTKTAIPRSPLAKTAPRPSPTVPRPSTTTRSSSPMSSDVASARFFSGPGYKQSSTSAHSSASSLLFDDVPPLPQPHLNNKTGNFRNHIVPPSELGKMGVNRRSDEGQHRGSQESLASLSRLARASPTPTSGRSQLMKLKVVVPPTSSPSSPVDVPLIVHTPAAELVSLPLPPRRAGRPVAVRRNTNTPTIAAEGWGERQQEMVQRKERDATDETMAEWERIWGASSGSPGEYRNGMDKDERSGSPIIPSFSTADPINAFMPKRISTDTKRSKGSSAGLTSPVVSHRHPVQLDEMGYSPAESLPPPPRSKKGVIRPASISTPTSPVRSPLLVSPRTARTSTSTSPSSRRSTGGHSVASTLTIMAHQRRRSSSFISSTTSLGSPPSPNSPSPPHRAVMFRELGRANLGIRLTEQEKAARWDDLLERSAQAGGTLHLNFGARTGEDGLKSDRLRFSDISELT
ncbi:hypothetical protein C0991_004854 [Blastosporella zonata]|nr:hypothetical protein C0991_004854 [Blastosporella zonata]